VTPGQPATYSVKVSPVDGFSQTRAAEVQWSAGSVDLLGVAEFHIAQRNIGLDSHGHCTTSGTSAGLTQPVGGPFRNHPFVLWVVFPATFGLTLLLGTMQYRPHGRPQLLSGFGILGVLSAAATMSACGGGINNGSGGTQAGTDTLNSDRQFHLWLKHVDSQCATYSRGAVVCGRDRIRTSQPVDKSRWFVRRCVAR
jgi:hypothetical protein